MNASRYVACAFPFTPFCLFHSIPIIYISKKTHFPPSYDILKLSIFVPTFSVILTSDSCHKQDMPAAEGAVAAAAVADQMYGPKEDRKLTIVLVSFSHMELYLY
jgi:hypothetical protein